MAVTRWRWRIQNYNAFLRDAKRQWTLNHRQAQQLYRDIRSHLGYSIRAVDLRRHPRLAKRYATAPPPPPFLPVVTIPIADLPEQISSVVDWTDLWEDDWLDEPSTIYEGTAEYEEAAHG